MNDPKTLESITHHAAVLAYHDTGAPGFSASARRFAELFEALVPARGEAESMQGEVLRSVARLASEDRRNGCMNWGKRYERFVDFLRQTLADERVFGEVQRARIGQDLDAVLSNGRRAGVDPEVIRVVFGRLIEDAIAYYEALPDLVARPDDSRLSI